jgi:long-chain acyl-CoA synthetase
MEDHEGMLDDISSQTIGEFFARTVASRLDESALGFIREGTLHWHTWQEVADAVISLGADLRAAGIALGDRVAHVSENRYEWIITDLALHLIEAVHVPIHVTLSGRQIAEQIRDSGARAVFVSTSELLARFADQLPRDLPIWLHSDRAGQPPAEPGAAGFATMHNPSRIPSPQPPAPSPSSLATILYTSGTTGCPRGVMLSHENLASNAAAVCEAHKVNADHTMLCVLPLSHIYARTCDLYTWIVSGSRLVLGENRETLLRDCQLVQPTALNAVPYVYQRIMDGICNSSADDKAAALRATFGGQMDSLFCGGAPVALDVETWYANQGLPLLPGYGLTEASPVIAVTTRHARRLGTVGQAIPGVENRIAPDGELLTRGPHVMLGYWQNEAATAEVIEDGWLRTGDLAELDADGFLTIRGRKKELIVLSTGKKVSPTRVEALLTASPLIDQVAVFGDGHCGLMALVVPAGDSVRNEERGTRSEKIKSEITRCLAHAAHEEQIHSFTLLDRPFSIERGELTAKLSLCRGVIARNFAAELSANREPRTG